MKSAPVPDGASSGVWEGAVLAAEDALIRLTSVSLSRRPFDDSIGVGGAETVAVLSVVPAGSAEA